MARERRDGDRGSENLTGATGGQPGLPGGSSGVADELVQTRHGTPAPTAGSAVLGAPPDDVPVRKYRVKTGGSTTFNGTRTMIRAGKVIDERQYDLEMLRSQGVVLEEIVPPAPAAAPGAQVVS